MNEPIADLWGEEFPEVRDDSAPVVLLKKQAEFLKRRTSGRVVGEVRQMAEDGTAWCSLYVRVPALGDYLYKLVSCGYSVYADPAKPSAIKVHDIPRDATEELTDPNELPAWLQTVLSSSEVHRIIGNLMKHSNDRVAS